MNLSVTKKFEFCYGHRLPGHNGKCCNIHGHNATLEVEIGKSIALMQNEFGVDRQTYKGMIIDFGDLKSFVKHNIVDVVDHQLLNDVIPSKFLPPTAENMCRWVWFVLDHKMGIGDFIKRIRIYETPDSYAELTNGIHGDPEKMEKERYA